MARLLGALLIGLMVGTGSGAAADEDPPPSAPAAEPDWKAEVAALEDRAAKAHAEQRLAAALELRTSAVALARRRGPGTVELAAALNQAAITYGSVGRDRDALPLMEESLATYRSLFQGDHPRVATCLGNLAALHHALGRPSEALSLFEQSCQMFRRLYPGDNPDVATSLNNLASGLDEMGRSAEALQIQAEALGMRRRLYAGDHPHVATSLNNLGQMLVTGGRAPEALALHEEALAMRRRLYPGDHPLVATSMSNLAQALEEVGRLADAFALYEGSLAMRRRLFPGDHPAVATGLENLAGALRDMGRPSEALPLQAEALAMDRRLYPGDHPRLARRLNNLAHTLGALGRHAEAWPLFEESLAMRRRIFPGDHVDVAIALNNMAGALMLQGRAAEAARLLEDALAMCRRLLPGDHPAVAAGLDSLSRALLAMGRAAEALPLEEESLAMRARIHAGDHPYVASSLNNRARILQMLGRLAEAIPSYEQARAMATRLGSPDRWRYGAILGYALVRAGRASEAVEPLMESVEGLEEQRSSARDLVAADRAQFVAAMREWADPYAILLRAQVAIGAGDAALEALERGRGRELLDLLHGSEADPTDLARERARARGDDRALHELGQARRAREAAEAEVSRRGRETERAGASSASRRDLIAAESEARRALIQALAVERRLVKEVLPEARPLSAAELRALLAADERLLAYSLGETDVYAFLVRPEAVELVRLESDGRPVTTEQIAQAVADHRDALTNPLADAVPSAKRLFSLLMPAAFHEGLRGVRRLYLMPEGPLEALPFETLVVGEREGKPLTWAETGPPIAYQASGSVLSWLRTRPAGAGKGAELVAVGDPAFAGARDPVVWPKQGVLLTEVRPDGQGSRLGLRPGDVLRSYDERPLTDGAALRTAVEGAGAERTDIRIGTWRDGETGEVLAASGRLGVSIASEPPDVAGPKLLAGGQLAIALRSAEERGKRLRPLPGSRREVEAIAGALRARRGGEARVTALLGRQATEAAFFEAAAGARYLHLATHGLVDETETASFSALALTMPTVPVPGDDGFLTLVDLFQRWQGRLTGTELVVLSACESARGKEQRFEGAYALPWGFLYSGARAVVASQWKVEDDATAFLMAEFYRRMLEGEDPLDALTAARLATKAKHPSPYHWGAFVFSGAPR